MMTPTWRCEFCGKINSPEQRECTYCMRSRLASKLELDRQMGDSKENE